MISSFNVESLITLEMSGLMLAGHLSLYSVPIVSTNYM